MIDIRIPSQDDILRVITDEEIYGRVSDDTCPKREDFKMNFDLFDFVGAYIDGKIAGLYTVNRIVKNLMHFMVLKEYRMKAREIFEACFLFYGKPVYCVIPECFGKVINFAKNVGFEEVERMEKFSLRNSILYDGVKLERGL